MKLDEAACVDGMSTIARSDLGGVWFLRYEEERCIVFEYAGRLPSHKDESTRTLLRFVRGPSCVLADMKDCQNYCPMLRWPKTPYYERDPETHHKVDNLP